MNNFSINIENIQHIYNLDLSIDLSTSGLLCVVGKNSTGKTTLFKSILNLLKTNTFAKTSHPLIYDSSSRITYNINNGQFVYQFNYDDSVKTLNYNGEISKEITDNIYVELPIPFGERFKQYKNLGHSNSRIKTKIAIGDYTKPIELICLLNYIYETDKFDDLIEISLQSKPYYILIPHDKPYIREDYLSSSEYFIITIYKIINSECKLIAIDEIDISLDSGAQVRCVSVFRELAEKYNIKLFFSTHSLALIKTLESNELIYMKYEDGICDFESASNIQIQEDLYGFTDYKEDRDSLIDQINSVTQPIIITEGKTDWKHLKKALKRFQEGGDYIDLDIKFLEYNNEIEMGDSQLVSMLKSYSKVEQDKKIIFMFDRDDDKYVKVYGEEVFNSHNNNVYSFCIPKINDQLDKISIEFYYKMDELLKRDSYDRQLFIGNDFYNSTGMSKCGEYHCRERNKAGKQVIIDNSVYKKDDLEGITSIALSKNDFAEYILNGEENFDNFDIENFKLIFNVIEEIVNN